MRLWLVAALVAAIAWRAHAQTTACGSAITFSSGLQGYTQSRADSFDWTRQTGPTSSSSTGPSSGYGGSGYYMYIETSSPRRLGQHAVLISPAYAPPPSTTCSMSFRYTMYGATVNTLFVNVTNTRTGNRNLLKLTGNKGSRWLLATVPISSALFSSASTFQVQFDAVVGSSFTSDIAIDQIAWTSSCCGASLGSPTRSTCGQEAVTFQNGDGGWTNQRGDAFDWTKRSGSTSSSGTGPSTDATPNSPFGRGNYYYIETSSPRRAGDTAIFTSPVFKAVSTPSSCQFNWFYHSYGSTTGSLALTLKTPPATTRQLWSINRVNVNRWQPGSVSLTGVTTNFQLTFTATVGTSFTGDISIDQLYFTGCCPTQPCATRPITFDLNANNFYSRKTTTRPKWFRRAGSTPSVSTGPTSDHTLKNGSGYYFYFEASSGATNSYDRLFSQVYAASRTTTCSVKFWYHMYGGTIGKLNVYIVPSSYVATSGTPLTAISGSGSLVPTWTKSGNQGNRWLQATMKLTLKTPFYMIFEAVRGTSYTGDISIDDVSFDSSCCIAWKSKTSAQIKSAFGLGTRVVRGVDWSWGNQDGGKGALGNVTSVLSSTNWVGVRWSNLHSNVYRMGSGSKYDLYLYKDSTTTVPSVSACTADATFETTQNPWINAKTDKRDWTRDSGGTSSSGTGPSVDHTLGTSRGYYMYFETSSPVANGDTAILESPALSQVIQDCSFTLWYHMYGSTIRTFTISLTQIATGTTSTLFTRSGNQGNRWIQTPVMPLKTSYGQFKILLTAVRGTSFTGDIAIDDIKFSPTCCRKVCIPKNTFGTTSSGSLNGWTNDKGDQLDWRVQKGSTSSSSTGPSSDHTGSGYYVYVETSSPARLGHTAILNSPLILGTGSACQMTFWYHMYGSTIGKLEVFTQSNIRYSLKKSLWSKSGNQGNKWISATVSTPAITWVYKIQLVVTRGSSFTGDVAVDDITFGTGCGCYSCSSMVNFDGNSVAPLIQSSADSTQWVLRRGATPSSSTGPTADHTLKTALGYYIHLEASSGSSGSNAVLYTPSNGPPKGPECRAVFWYHMYGSTIGSLNVRQSSGTTSPDKGAITWSLKGNQGNLWQRGIANITLKTAFVVAFEAVRGTSFTGDVALDDIWLTPDCCTNRPDWSKIASQITSSFRQGTRVIRGKDWSWGSQGSGTAGTIVQGLGNYSSAGWVQVRWDDGHLNSYRMGASSKYDLYIQIPQQVKVVPTKPPTTGPPTTPPINGYCLNWKSYSVAQLTLIFAVGTRVTRGVDWSWGTQGSGTNGTVISPIASTGWLRVRWDDGHLNSYRMGNNGKYDLCLVNNISVPVFPATAPPACGYTNNFDSSFNFTQDLLDTFDWTRQRGSTSSSSTGPARDHTSGTGYYVYIETSFPRTSGDIARMYTPFFTSPSLTCGFTFWYHMYGTTVNTLRVSIQTATGTKQLWTKSGNQGNRWLSSGTIALNYGSVFRIMFEGIAGTSFTGDIAVDDFTFTKTCCADQTCGAAPATFETGLDGFTQHSNDTFDWTRRTGSTSSSSTGPSSGHAGSRYYMYIETSFPRRAGDVAILTSKTYSVTLATCEYGFWYHMYGASIGSLSVMVSAPGSTTFSTIWTKSGNQGNTWQFARAAIPASFQGKSVQVHFRGVSGTSFTGDIAIDDAGFEDGCCRVAKACGSRTTTFQTGLEGYTQDATDDLQWTRRSGGTPSFATGPSVDHTLANSTGYYMYIETSGQTTGKKARLLSRPISSNESVCSVNFWYHMYGSTVNTLNVYVKTPPSTMKLAWTKQGNQGNLWRLGNIYVNKSTEFQLVFEAITGTSFTADIAIDDISFNQDCCGIYCSESYKSFNPLQVSVMFAGQTRVTRGVTWGTSYGSQDGGWGRQGTVSKAPPKLSFGVTSVKWDTGKTYSYQVGSAKEDLCRRYPLPYYSGYSAAELQRIFYQNVTVFRGRDWKWGTQDGNDFGIVTVNMSLHNNVGWVRVLFPSATGTEKENSYRMGAEGAYDLFRVCDVDLAQPCKASTIVATTPPPSPTIPVPVGTDFCNNRVQDFEAGFGAFTQDTSDHFDWIRQRGSTSSSSTGPSTDHTTGSGYYIYIETSSPRSAGDVARLLSPWYKAPKNTCTFFFWYHMLGSTIGSLNITIVTAGGSTLAWTRKGAQGSLWNQGSIPVLSSWGTFRMIFAASRGTSFTGDIALDDFEFGKDCCRDCNSSPITFESGLQGFTQSKTDTFDWSRNTGGTSSSSTGPTADHTTGAPQGAYMYIETSFPRRAGDVAILVSPQYSAPPGFQCSMQFFYNMYGATIGNLSVIIRQKAGTSTTDKQVWSLAGNQGRGWKEANINIDYGTADYNVVFRAVAGSSFTGDIAIDDLSFSTGCCSTCKGPSTFESGMGFWTQSKNDQFDWTRIRGRTSSSSTGPPRDHTPGVSAAVGGYYMYAESSSPRRTGDQAILLSPVFGAPTAVGCRMTFYYHMYGASQGSFEVRIFQDTTRNYTAFKVSGDQGDVWKKQTVLIPTGSHKDYQVTLISTRGTSFTSDVAVDDISFSSECCSQGCISGNTFETGVAPYVFGSQGNFNWTLRSGGTPSFATGPSADHTVGSSLGRYLYIETSGARAGNKAYLLTPLVTSASSGCAVTFWYHMYGTTIGSLNVDILRGTSTTSVAAWSRKGNQGNRWIQGRLTIPSAVTSFRVQWVGTVGTSFTGDIALDDIAFTSQCCNQVKKLPVYSTTPKATLFDKFKNGSLVVRGKDWIWGSQDVGVIGVVVRPLDSSGTCDVQWTGSGLKFTYSMGNGGKYELYALADLGGASSGGSTIPVYDTSKCPKTYAIYSKTQLIALFKNATRVVRGADWKWGSQDGGLGKPGTITAGYTPLFNQVAVKWDSDPSRSYRYRVDGTTFDLCRINDILNGPVTVWPVATPTAALICPDYTVFSAVQIAFAFQNNTRVVRGKDWAYGSQDGGSAGVTVSPVVAGVVRVMWTSTKRTFSYNVGAGGKFDLCRSADVGKTSIVIIVPTTQPPQVCGNPVTFDVGLQGYTNMKGDDFDWTRQSRATGSFATGPSKDHTFGNDKGYYMYIETSLPRRVGDVARLISPLYLAPPTQHCQMTFWYHMYGATIGTLNVYLVQAGKPDVRLWNKTGNAGDQWFQAKLDIAKYVTGSYQVKFEAIAGTSFTGDIAIDDVFQGVGCCSATLPDYTQIAPLWTQLATLFPVGTRVVRGKDWSWGAQDGGPGGEGSVTRTVSATSQTMQVKWDNGNTFSYRMGQGGKYDLYRLLDLYSGITPTLPPTTLPPVNPGDGSCTKRADFERDFNGMIQGQNDTFDWTRQRGSTPSFLTGPDADHTTGTAAGYYIYIETSSPRVAGDYATIYTPWQASPPTNHCRVNFYYHMHGASINALNVTIRTRTPSAIKSQQVWRKAGDNKNVWEFGSFAVPAHSPAFQIGFTGIVGTSFDGDIALDDISLSAGCCQAHPDYSQYTVVSGGPVVTPVA